MLILQTQPLNRVETTLKKQKSWFVGLKNQSGCSDWTVRKAVGKFWGNWSGRGSNLLPLAQRSKQAVFHLSCSLCQGLTNGIGWQLMLPLPLLVPFGTSQASQLHVNPPNLGSQMLRLQGGAATLSFALIKMRDRQNEKTRYTMIVGMICRENAETKRNQCEL